MSDVRRREFVGYSVARLRRPRTQSQVAVPVEAPMPL
jgi:hypothetical protein